MGVPSPGPSSRPSSCSSLQLPGDPPAYTEDGFFDAPGPSSDGIGNTYPSRRWRSLDPRTSSTQSLVPSLSSQEQRRTLLLIYVHGFMGNDTSFRSFPAHIHQFLKESLAETHGIHTKIYPRYKTYKSIEVARDNFSLWLEPHESPTTDIVLIGHSMGGLLAADVALQRSQNGTYGWGLLRHRILGTISLDAPLLGLHPGIVVSGIASLFRPAAIPVGEGNPGSEQSLPLSPDSSIYSEVAPPSDAPSPALTQTSSYQNQKPSTSDPFFNPSFFNDASFVDRGWFRNIAHFAKKHREENLVGAAANHIMSHLEFGGCLADYPGLQSRYSRLRKLEDVDDLVPSANGESAVRVRFVNYYTVSTGPLKKPKSELPAALLRPGDAGQKAPEKGSVDIASRPSTPTVSTGATTPRISIEDHSDSGRPIMMEEIEPIPEPDDLVFDGPTSTTHDESKIPPKTASSDTAVDTKEKEDNTSLMDERSEHHSIEDHPLPPIPDLPPPPPTVDLSIYTDKDSRKQAEKEAKRLQKVYDQAVKNRDKALKEREKLIEKRRRKTQKEAEKQLKQDQKKKSKEEQDQPKKTKTTQPEDVTTTQDELEDYRRRRGDDLQEQELFHAMEKTDLKDELKREKTKQKDGRKEVKDKDDKKDKKDKDKETKKLRKFCMLPGRINGAAVGQDPTWVQVYMEGVDEVGAHCGLFFPGPHYEKLVGDVGSRIVGWVLEDCSKRAVFDLD